MNMAHTVEFYLLLKYHHLTFWCNLVTFTAVIAANREANITMNVLQLNCIMSLYISFLWVLAFGAIVYKEPV